MDSANAPEDGTSKSGTQSLAKLMAALRKKLLDLSMRYQLLNYRIVPEDEPQDNQSLKAKLKEERDFNLPAFIETGYLATVKRVDRKHFVTSGLWRAFGCERSLPRSVPRQVRDEK